MVWNIRGKLYQAVAIRSLLYGAEVKRLTIKRILKGVNLKVVNQSKSLFQLQRNTSNDK